MLLLYAVARPLLNSTFTVTDPTIANVDANCTDLGRCRTLSSIILSCLSVIIICNWTSIHPNVPSVTRSNIRGLVLWHACQITLISLLAPEVIVLWAMRQWVVARRVLERYKKYGWTTAHAYLAVMGGFALYDQGVFKCHLLPEVYQQSHIDQEREIAKGLEQTMQPAMSEMLQRNAAQPEEPSLPPIIDGVKEQPLILTQYPCLLEFFAANGFITIEERLIRGNMSRSDVITKSIAILQTSWFMLQCLARGIEGIAVTELEIHTLAFATLNGMTYILWWNKPQRVRYPIPVHWRPSNVLGNNPNPTNDETSSKMNMFCYHFGRATTIIILFPLFAIVWLYQLLVKATLGNEDLTTGDSLFISGLQTHPMGLKIAMSVIAFGFGALHCIAWNFTFPTELERLLWRVFSAMLAALPPFTFCVPFAIGILLGIIIRVVIGQVKIDVNQGTYASLLRIVILTGAIILPMSYIVARVGLIVLALMELRRLPASAYQTVDWLKVIPHVG